MNKSVGTTVELRQKNRRELLSQLIEKGETTRNALRNDSGFSYTTIGNLLGDLQDEGFIVQQGEAQSTGGRKAQVIRVNSDRGYFLSIDISGKLFKWGIYSLDGNSRRYNSHEFVRQISFKENFRQMLLSIRSYCTDESILTSLCYIGVVIPGYYNEAEDLITDSYNEDEIGSMRLKDIIHEYFSATIIVKNDAKTAAYSEVKFLENPEEKQLYYFLVLKESFGAAFLLNGKIYQGAGGYAGEIYPMVQNAAGKERTLGDLLYPAGDLKTLSESLGEDISEHRFFELYKEKNPAAMEIFFKTATAISRGLIPVLCILNPSDIRIGGFYNYYGEELLFEINRQIRESGEDWQYKDLTIKFSDFSQYTLIDSIAVQMINLWVGSLWTKSSN